MVFEQDTSVSLPVAAVCRFVLGYVSMHYPDIAHLIRKFRFAENAQFSLHRKKFPVLQQETIFTTEQNALRRVCKT
ncbi:hypothetical protein NPIL_601041 [Nephila pilipes]|uniref:Uncharacterized protein n=1 Tax=Nephila pilipes TaxID=299642 RepID=A0A8X6Q4C2_NEPPI|nr:hypothetical protein NPIL_601041 [Nephila pilipes]